jgi:hypothetical protein
MGEVCSAHGKMRNASFKILIFRRTGSSSASRGHGKVGMTVPWCPKVGMTVPWCPKVGMTIPWCPKVGMTVLFSHIYIYNSIEQIPS